MKKYPKGKIKRVFLEYEDGTLELTGQDAEEWKEMVNGQAVLAHTHSLDWPELNWIIKLREVT